MATVVCYPVAGANSPVDGYTYSGAGATDTTLSALVSGSGVTSDDTGNIMQASLVSSTTSGQFNSIRRAIICFDTTSIPDGAVVTSAIISLNQYVSYTNIGAYDLHVVSSSPLSTASLSPSDYSRVGSVSFGSINSSSITSGYNDITLNSSGRANVAVNSISKFGIRVGWDLNDSFTGTWASYTLSGLSFTSADYSGGSPKLTVTYTYTPPPTIQGISSTQGLQSITL